jgi:hypothetical protein
MKNQPTTRLAPPRHTQPQPPTPRPHDPEARQRRLYTDFLALAFYPGMRPAEPRPERVSAA